MRLRDNLRSPLWRGDLATGVICLLPSLAVIAVFVVFPIFFSLYLSFHKWAILTTEKPFVARHHRLFFAEILAIFGEARYTLESAGPRGE